MTGEEKIENEKQTNIEHVDERNHNFFMIDNEIIDNYKLSVDADSLYSLIVRRAQHKKTCFPSIRRWMKEKHRGHDKAKNAVKELTEKGLIKIDGRKYPNGPFIYRILPVKKGVSASGTPIQEGVSEPEKGVPSSETGGVPASGTEKDKDKKTRKKKEERAKTPAPGPDSTDKLYRACSDQFYIRYASEIAGTDVDMDFIQDHPKYKPKYSMKDWNALKWMRQEGLTPQMVDFFWGLAARDKSEYVSSSRLYIWFYKKEWNYYHKEWMKSSSKQSQDRQLEDTHRKRKLEDKYLEDVDAGREVPRKEVAKVFHGLAGNIAKSKNLKDT